MQICNKQAEKLKSCMKEGWMKNVKNEWMKNYEGWMMKDDDFKLFRGLGDGRTNRRSDICDCRVAFETENISHLWSRLYIWISFTTYPPICRDILPTKNFYENFPKRQNIRMIKMK